MKDILLCLCEGWRAGLAGLALVTVACAEPPIPPAAEVEAAPVIAAAGPQLIAAPAVGEVAAIVRESVAAGTGPLVVSVGADWCEPCRAFHDALKAGELDEALAGVRFLEFDIDRDRERLEAAGYSSRLVPLFAIPGEDGRAGARRIEGGIKGPQAVAHIMSRLRPLLGGAAP